MLQTRDTHNATVVVPNKILTKRRLEYLTLVGLGLCNREIADLLCVSLSTVKKTLEEIFWKLNAIDRANAIFIAYMQNLLTNELCSNVLDKYPKARNIIIQKTLKRIYSVGDQQND